MVILERLAEYFKFKKWLKVVVESVGFVCKSIYIIPVPTCGFIFGE